MTDLHFLCTAILGYSHLVPPDRFHGDMCTYATQRTLGARLQLIPRSHFKSTIATIGSTIQDLIIDPNETILIMTGSTELHTAFLATIKEIIESNTILQGLYPYLKPDKHRKWAGDRFCVQRDTGIAEPSVTALSWKQSPEGSHYGRIKLDDLTTLANVETPKIQDKVIEKFSDVWSNVHTHDILGSGTRYTDYDVYNYMIEELISQDDMQLLKMEAEDGKFGNILFPERFPEKKLRTLRRVLKERYWAQYLNEVAPLEYQKIKQTMFKYYTQLPEVTFYVGADPASGVGTSKPAIVVVAIDEPNNLYVVEVMSDFNSTGEFIDGLFEVAHRYTPQEIRVEGVGHAGKMLQEQMANEMRKRRDYPVVRYPPAPKTQKAIRIETTLSGPYSSGTIFHAKKLKGSDLEYQLTRLHKARALDEADALSYGVAAALKWGYTGPVKPPLKEGYNEGPDLYNFVWRPGKTEDAVKIW